MHRELHVASVPLHVLLERIVEYVVDKSYCALVIQINRESIDAVKNYFREDLQKSDWQLMIELKKLLQII